MSSNFELECLDRMILFGERNLLLCMRAFTVHYHGEHNHQGIGNELIGGGKLSAVGTVECRERLGGLLEYYRRAT